MLGVQVFKKRSALDGKVKLPIVLNASNFLKSTSEEPTLLTLDDLETLFHEFGHSLHNLLSKCKYPFLSGTNVTLDFVELPSMFTQRFHLEEDLLEKFAKHYKTNKAIPFEIIERVKNYKKFNQGFEKTYDDIADDLLDIEIHTLKNYKNLNPSEFEKKVMKKIGLIPEMFLRYNLTRFRHIFFWEYEVGYYSYLWSEVLACDAFEYFKKNGLLNRKLGLSFRKNILEKGDSEDPMILYKRFRGRKPNVNAFLTLNGLI